MNEIKEYRYNKFFLNIYLVLSIICAIFIVIFFFISIYFNRIIVGSFSLIIPVILYFTCRNFIVLRLHDDFFELKIAPLRSIKFARYEEIDKIEIKGKMLFFYLKHRKKLAVHLSAFDREKRDEVTSFFMQKIK